MHKTQIEIRGVFWAVALVFSVFLVLPMALLGPAHVFSFVSGFNLQLVLSATLFAVRMAAALINASGFAPR